MKPWIKVQVGLKNMDPWSSIGMVWLLDKKEKLTVAKAVVVEIWPFEIHVKQIYNATEYKISLVYFEQQKWLQKKKQTHAFSGVAYDSKPEKFSLIWKQVEPLASGIVCLFHQLHAFMEMRSRSDMDLAWNAFVIKEASIIRPPTPWPHWSLSFNRYVFLFLLFIFSEA